MCNKRARLRTQNAPIGHRAHPLRLNYALPSGEIAVPFGLAVQRASGAAVWPALIVSRDEQPDPRVTIVQGQTTRSGHLRSLEQGRVEEQSVPCNMGDPALRAFTLAIVD